MLEIDRKYFTRRKLLRSDKEKRNQELFRGEVLNFAQDFDKQGVPELIEKEDRELLDKMVYCEGEKRRSRLNVSYYCRYYYEAKQEECRLVTALRLSLNFKRKTLFLIENKVKP